MAQTQGKAIHLTVAHASGRVAEHRSFATTIWTLAWPAILTFGLESVVGLVDMVMVGRLGAHAVASVGVGSQILHAVCVVMIGGATGTVALVARYVGAGEQEAAEDVLLQSLYAVGFLATLVAVPVALWSADIVNVFGVEAAVLTQAADYVRFIMLGVPFAALFTMVGSGLRGAGDMRTPLALGVLVNVLNVAGNYVLIFGKLGLPALGVRGAALASAVAMVIGAGLGLVVLCRESSVLRLPLRRLRFDGATAWRVLRIGSPTAVEQLFVQIGYLLYLSIAAVYGTSAVAAYVIGVRILALSFLPGFGFGAAASTLVGQRIGADDAHGAERSGWVATILAILFMSVGGVAIFLAAESIARLFVDDAVVVREAVSFMYILALAQPWMATDFTLAGALRGAGDTRFPLITVLIGFYGVRLGAALLAAHVFDLGITWVWAALLGDYVVRSALKIARFRGDSWRTIKV